MKKLILVLCGLLFVLRAAALSVDHLRVQQLSNSEGIDAKTPLFSWQLQSADRGVVQTAYQIVVTTDAEGNDVFWDSGLVTSSASVDVPSTGLLLKASTRYFWHVTVHDNKGQSATSTELAYFDTSLLSTSKTPLSPAIWLKAPDIVTSATVASYAFDFDMYLVKGRASVIFAHVSAGNYCMWQLNCLDSDDATLRRHVYVDGSYTATDAAISAFSKSQLVGSLHHYRIEVAGTTVKTFIDGTLIDTFAAPAGTTALGDVGMRVYGSGEEAWFDNLKLTTFSSAGTGTVRLSEDFESEQAFDFPDAEIATFLGSRMCHMASASGENKVMQVATEGAPMFRKTFTLGKPIRSAKLYTSGLGIYDVFINGKRVGHVQPDGSVVYEELKPGYTDYRTRVFYSSHDVTALLAEGANAIGAVVTSGWWAGAISNGLFGGTSSLGFIAKLVVFYEDGTKGSISTDLTWRSSRRGPILSGEIYDGEIYDARRRSDWTLPSFDDSEWSAVQRNTAFTGRIDAEPDGYVRQLADKVQTVRTANIYQGTKSTGTDYGAINIVSSVSIDHFSLRKGQGVVIDFGQNIVGWPRFKVRGKSGTRLSVSLSEMLNDNGSKSRGNDGPGGSPYLANLRTAKAALSYILCGDAEGEEYQPSMTFYGFRYVRIVPSDDVEVLSIVAQPVSSCAEDVGTFSSSNSLVNQLVSNIQGGQRGNMLSVPTDCPQRDERLGWTGDILAFCRAAMYNADVEKFLRKWLQDMRDSQRDDGCYATVAPYSGSRRYGAAAWSDAGIIVAWRLYQMYGNKDILRENFAAQEKYMEWLATQSADGFTHAGASTAYGDWLAYSETDKRYISVAYYAYDALIMSKIARVLSTSAADSYAKKADTYETLYKVVRQEFRSHYITPTVKQTTQTAYLLALQFGLLEDDEVPSFVNRLATAIRSNSYKLNTGFIGTSIINPVLSQFGLTDYAYDLLLQRSNPSWLYSVDQGATTIWERWNSYTLNSGFGSASMNSFNHYAYGAVGEWLFSNVLGIDIDEQEPGFHHFILQPQPDRRTTLPSGQKLLTTASGSYRSRYGTIESSWSAPDEHTLVYRCTVPANTTATLRFPASSKDMAVYETGVPAADAEGVTFVGYEEGCLVYELGSGSYIFGTDAGLGVAQPTANATCTASWYDLSGFRFESEPTRRGVYIHAGKKVLK